MGAEKKGIVSGRGGEQLRESNQQTVKRVKDQIVEGLALYGAKVHKLFLHENDYNVVEKVLGAEIKKKVSVNEMIYQEVRLIKMKKSPPNRSEQGLVFFNLNNGKAPLKKLLALKPPTSL